MQYIYCNMTVQSGTNRISVRTTQNCVEYVFVDYGDKRKKYCNNFGKREPIHKATAMAEHRLPEARQTPIKGIRSMVEALTIFIDGRDGYVRNVTLRRLKVGL